MYICDKDLTWLQGKANAFLQLGPQLRLYGIKKSKIARLMIDLQRKLNIGREKGTERLKIVN